MNLEERATLDEWTLRLAGELGLSTDEFVAALDVDAVLSLAGTAARSVLRPAAPVTTFLVGYAAGLAAASGSTAQEAIGEATATAIAVCAQE